MVLEMQYSILHCSSRYHPLNALALLLAFDQNRKSPLQQLLGGGANYTLTVSNNYAHNDWIEILVNQGILGIFVFFMYWKSFFRTAFRTNLDKTCSIVIKMIFIGYFAKTMFSMSYTDYNIMVNLCLGYCISRIDTTKSLTI